MTDINKRHPASFRDPDGYVFEEGGLFLRRLRASCAQSYETLMSSGCYQECVEKGLLVPHEDISDRFSLPPGEKVLLPEQLCRLSYPCEWSFSQLQAAALCTLDILRIALSRGMILKDASAFNLAWSKGRMVFFDTLSFASYCEGEPWAAYGQFCRHFLAPLALMRHRDVRCNALWLHHLDGIPLDLASRLLPWRTWLSPSLVLHIHAHAALSRRKADSDRKVRVDIRRKTLEDLAESLRHAVLALAPPRVKTEWGEYYSGTNYSEAQREEKQTIIDLWLRRLGPDSVLDLGSNDGHYSRLAARHAKQVLSLDIDPVAVDANVCRCMEDKDERIFPLLANITAPTPALGWNGKERSSLFERISCDCGLALALVHHVAISGNVPLPDIFCVLRRLAPVWIVEFVDKEDSQLQRLLRNRPDIFPDYHREGFEQAAGAYFSVEDRREITGMRRTLYLLRAANEGGMKPGESP